MTDSIETAPRIKRLKESATIAVSTKAQALRREGVDVINLSTGEPDFDTPDYIKRAASDAMLAGQTKYTTVAGTVELREAICRKLSRDSNLSFNPNQIVATCGAKHAIMNVMQTLVGADDEVIIPAPCWVSFPDIVSYVGGNPVIIPTTSDNNYKITPEQLAEHITSKTKVFLINSPSNPSGAVYTKEELLEFGKILEEHPNIYITSDEIYEHIVYDDVKFNSIASVCPNLLDRTIIINGVSKAYAMTGWRLGFSASNEQLAKTMTKVQSQTTSNISTITQAAAIAAFDSDLNNLKPMLEAFSARRSRVVSVLEEIEDLVLPPIDGAFYALPDVTEIRDRLFAAGKFNENTDIAFCNYILEEIKIAVVPGNAFNAPGSFRMSFAAKDESIDTALERFKKLFTKD